MAKDSSKGQNYLHGAAIMTVGVILMKILGAIYKIPLGNMLGDDGYALFLSAYYVYSVFLTLATAGFPVAMSRMVSAAHTQNRTMQERRIYKVSLITFLGLGVVCSLAMFLFPERLADLMNNPDIALSIKVLSPAVLLCCVASAYRGLTQGYGNMIPTTVSQVMDVVAKVAVGLLLAWYFVKQGRELSVSAAGAIFGVVAGSLAALVYMMIYKRLNYRFDVVAEPDTPDSNGEIFRELIRIGIPIALGSVVLSLLNMIDSSLCMGRLQAVSGFSYSQAETLYGVYGKAQTLFNLPAAFITPLTVSIVPAIAAEIVKKNHGGAAKISEDSLRISMALALPMGIGLAVLSEPIMDVLYPTAHEAGGLLLCLLGLASVFVCFSLMSTAVLQASGSEKLTIYSIVAGGIVKIAVNWFLVATPQINIYGAPIGTICCYITMCAMNLIFIRRSIKAPISMRSIFIRPLLPSLIMGAVAFVIYQGAMSVLPQGRSLYTLVGMCASIAAAVIVYAISAIRLRAITAEDMKLIPKGDKIAKLLKMK